jgi:hypothetical protein
VAEGLLDAESRVQAPHHGTEEAVTGTDHAHGLQRQRRRVEDLALRYQECTKVAERQCNHLGSPLLDEASGRRELLLPSIERRAHQLLQLAQVGLDEEYALAKGRGQGRA